MIRVDRAEFWMLLLLIVQSAKPPGNIGAEGPPVENLEDPSVSRSGWFGRPVFPIAQLDIHLLEFLPMFRRGEDATTRL
jgi:hypothetical protein